MGKDINDMQLGCLWSKDNIITVSLSGFINYLDRNNPSQPRKILKVSETCLCSKDNIITVSLSGFINYMCI